MKRQYFENLAKGVYRRRMSAAVFPVKVYYLRYGPVKHKKFRNVTVAQNNVQGIKCVDDVFGIKTPFGHLAVIIGVCAGHFMPRVALDGDIKSLARFCAKGQRLNVVKP